MSVYVTCSIGCVREFAIETKGRVITVPNLAGTLANALRLWVDVGRFMGDY